MRSHNLKCRRLLAGLGYCNQKRGAPRANQSRSFGVKSSHVGTHDTGKADDHGDDRRVRPPDWTTGKGSKDGNVPTSEPLPIAGAICGSTTLWLSKKFTFISHSSLVHYRC